MLLLALLLLKLYTSAIVTYLVVGVIVFSTNLYSILDNRYTVVCTGNPYISVV